MNDITRREENALSPEITETVTALVKQMMEPIFASIGKMLEHNARAMEQIAAAQQMTAERMDALEKQVRLNTPMSAKQAQYINQEIRARARELLDKKGLADDKKAVTKLANAIRKSVLARNGASGLREIPKHLYEVCFNQIGMWNDMLAVRDIVKEARERAEHAEQSAGMDGAEKDACEGD